MHEFLIETTGALIIAEGRHRMRPVGNPRNEISCPRGDIDSPSANPKAPQLIVVRQIAVNDQVGGFYESGFLRQFFDGNAAILQNPFSPSMNVILLTHEPVLP